MPSTVEPEALRPPGPVLVGDLLPRLHGELMDLLRGLAPEDWERPTSAEEWRVRDVVAHLVDGDLRRLSFVRDGHPPPPPPGPIQAFGDLVTYLNELNARWVAAARRLSPRVLIEMLDVAGPRAAETLAALDPFGPAVFAVAWAGQDASPNWLDVGREYTERWHHQDQVREAVGVPPLAAPGWLRAVIQVSLWALPHAYRDVEAEPGASVVVAVEGDAGGTWSLVHGRGEWDLLTGEAAAPHCRVGLDALAAARLLLHRLSPAQARAAVRIEGEARLAEPLLRARAVMV